jgi:hypothetical protein
MGKRLVPADFGMVINLGRELPERREDSRLKTF